MGDGERMLWPALTLEQRAERAERSQADDLHRCPNAWAVRRRFIDEETGEAIRGRCNRWDCLYCGPRKVDLWRQLVKEAQPTLFLTLSKAGNTVEQAARAFQTFIQALRRGSKGKGVNHVGARAAYLIEYFAVLERHKDFERNGFHWHILIKGVDAIPYKEVIQPLWISATHYDETTGQGAKIGYIQRVRNARAIGYVTKYLTKALATGERGTREVQRTRGVLVDDDIVGVRYEQQTITEEVESKARRIRYSRHFFPESVSTLREKLFAEMEQQAMEPATPSDQAENGKPLEKRPSSWRLVERERGDVEEYKKRRYEELADGLVALRECDYEAFQHRKREIVKQVAEEARAFISSEYRRMKREALLEALEEERPLSRRVINVWNYQRKQQEQ